MPYVVIGKIPYEVRRLADGHFEFTNNHSGASYCVTYTDCTCNDRLYRKRVCKHMTKLRIAYPLPPHHDWFVAHTIAPLISLPTGTAVNCRVVDDSVHVMAADRLTTLSLSEATTYIRSDRTSLNELVRSKDQTILDEQWSLSQPF